MKGFALAGFGLMIVAILGLGLSHALFSASPVVIVLQGAAAGLMIWARITFGRRSFHAGATPTSGGLVTTGPYRFIRHPIYTAVCLFAWAGIGAHLAAGPVALGVLLMAGTFMRMTTEERLVAEQYPEYREYARRTKRMVPYLF